MPLSSKPRLDLSSALHFLPTRLSLFFLSAATLTFEVNLTRLFSVAQFYHFAFMIVSIALLGFGASGAALAIFPGLGQKHLSRSAGWLALATGLSIVGAYLLTNSVPFDSFSIAWDSRQALLLVAHYVALTLPFFFSGMLVGLLLAAYPRAAGQTYAVNLLGSASGCVIALIAPPALSAEGTVMLSAGLAALAAAIQIGQRPDSLRRSHLARVSFGGLAIALLLIVVADIGLRLSGRDGLPLLALRLSPYKGLSYALQYPDAQVTYRRWNSFSRVDVVRSSSIHSVPGLSFRYLQPLPPEDGLLVDGDDLNPIVDPNADLRFVEYLSSAIAFRLRPQADVLILEPRGGLDVLSALALGARRVTVVEVNPLIVEAAGEVYRDHRVQVIVDSDRSYTRRSDQLHDVIVLSLAASFHPIRSGAYSLAEDYRYTVEAFVDALARLKPNGLLVITRWLQMPPSEELRTFALAVTALERSGLDPRAHVVALRTYNTATLLVKKSPFVSVELQAVRDFASERAFDLIYAPDIRPDEVNRYSILPEPIYSEAFTALLDAEPREAFYAAYPFDVSPPTDDRPFFGHYFKWSQAGQVLSELGKTWQPFGGAGYFVVVALLLLATALAGVLIVLPVVLTRRRSSPAGSRPRHSWASLMYFGAIGLAFLLVEIPLIQRFILFLGHPSYALMSVLFTLLLFSGVGSALSERLPARLALALLVVLLLIAPWLLPILFDMTLGFPLAFRLGLTVIILAPIGFLMGVPFPGGIQWLMSRDDHSAQVAWVWAVNGAASVISAVLAALLALSFGFNTVFRLGALCYAGALLTLLIAQSRGATSRPRP